MENFNHSFELSHPDKGLPINDVTTDLNFSDPCAPPGHVSH